MPSFKSDVTVTGDVLLFAGAGGSYTRHITLDVGDITTLQAITVDVTYAAASGNFTMLHCEINLTAQRATSGGAYGYLHGWVDFNTAAGTASIKGYELNFDTSGTPACSVVEIADGIRFTFDSSAFSNTLNNNTLNLLISGVHADAVTVTVT